MATIVFFHAHPDDEAIATGGTMAELADAGHRVVLVTATRGELGEIPEGLLSEGQSLAERRADELAEACRILGVERQIYLDYLDSGMAGEASNERAGCFAAADVDEAAGHLMAILEELQADVLVTYDEHGGYGHPDHVQVHRVGIRAAERAATPVIYMATMNRDYLKELSSGASAFGWSPPDEVVEGMETMGEPASRITTDIDVTRWVKAKREAMRAHTSQIAEDSFFLSMPDDVFALVWGHEWYIRVRPPWTEAEKAESETALALDGGAGHHGRGDQVLTP